MIERTTTIFNQFEIDDLLVDFEYSEIIQVDRSLITGTSGNSLSEEIEVFSVTRYDEEKNDEINVLAYMTKEELAELKTRILALKHMYL